MGWTEVWQYSKLVKCPLENQYFASYIAIRAVYFDCICMYCSAHQCLTASTDPAVISIAERMIFEQILQLINR